ncbi:alpha-2 adrenergic receptor [Trichonephila clavipes]|nr:alpha-2 adrenergic receptor [Trichonephila clavipes]
MIPPAHKAHQTVSFSGCNDVSTYTCGLVQNAAVLFVDVAIQPEVRFIAKQNSLMKIGNNGNLVLGPFDESTPCLMIILMNCQTKLRINHLTAVKSVAILESNANLNFYT